MAFSNFCHRKLLDGAFHPSSTRPLELYRAGCGLHPIDLGDILGREAVQSLAQTRQAEFQLFGLPETSTCRLDPSSR
jgi:hypothetical protein